MIIAACNCGQAITGDDRDVVVEMVSGHLRGSPSTMSPMGYMAEHSALVGEADVMVALTVAVEPPGRDAGPRPQAGTPEFDAQTAGLRACGHGMEADARDRLAARAREAVDG